jgi:integrase
MEPTLRLIRNESFPEGEAMILDEFVSILWRQLPVTAKTIENYQGAYRRYIRGEYGGKELAEIERNDLLATLARLSTPSRFQTLMMLRTVYREAIERELVLVSPVQTIKAPRVVPKPARFLTWQELNEIDFGRQNQRIRFLALHGLRFGEAAALTTADIYDGKVHITKSKYGPTKSTSGIRQVPYLGFFDPFPQFQLTIAEKLKPYGVTVHSLRKTYAYSLKSANVHITTASKLMGHSNPMITMKIYTLVRDEEISESGEALRRSLSLLRC